jgi:tRNA (guanine-N7-)-methyltransferase
MIPVEVKPPPDRVYGRGRGHKLRPRQVRLLQQTLPRIAFRPEDAVDPRRAFATPVCEVWLEVGFGSGEHALAQISARPDIGLIASEVFENGVCSLLSRLVPEGGEAEAELPGNLRLWTDDARKLLRLLPHGSLDRLFLLFPDPWPKARHAKRRFVHPALLPVLARALKPGAEWHVATDDLTYQAWVADVIGAQEMFETRVAATTRPADWPTTRYEAKALSAGRGPVYWSFIRR